MFSTCIFFIRIWRSPRSTLYPYATFFRYQAVRNINTDPALTPEARAEAIKELGGAPKHLLFEYLNASFKTGPVIAKALKVDVHELIKG